MPDDADASPPDPVPHPDDRLWRHPSELGLAPHPARPSGHRTAPVVVLAAGAVGAVVAVVVLAVTGSMSPRVVDRREAGATTTAIADRADLAEATARSVAGVEVSRAGGTAEGSAVVVRPTGLLATSAALVAGALEVRVVLPNGQAHRAEVLGHDPLTGLAALRIDGAGLTSVVPATAPARAGDTMMGVASGTAGTPVVTPIAVQAVGTGAKEGDTWLGGLLRLDRPLPEASDGGALVGADGRVTGVCLRLDAGGFAVPWATAAAIADELAEHGEVRWPWMGLYVSPASVTRLRAARVDAGLLVTEAPAQGPAAQAGVEAGDLLTAVDGEPVATPDDLHGVVTSHRAGHALELTLVGRDGDARTVSVTLAPRPG